MPTKIKRQRPWRASATTDSQTPKKAPPQATVTESVDALTHRMAIDAAHRLGQSSSMGRHLDSRALNSKPSYGYCSRKGQKPYQIWSIDPYVSRVPLKTHLVEENIDHQPMGSGSFVIISCNFMHTKMSLLHQISSSWDTSI